VRFCRLIERTTAVPGISAVLTVLFLANCGEDALPSATPNSDSGAGGTIVGGGGTGGLGGGTGGGGTGGSGGHEQAQKPAQETYRGAASTDCVSPFQNASRITLADAPRCDCKTGTVACAANTQFICDGSWMGVPVADCSVPNACIDVSNASFQATTLQPCQQGAGTYQCAWIISFNAGVVVSYEIARGLAPLSGGAYRCDGMSVVLEGATPTVAVYDAAARTLSMGGVTYQPR
jgi:hypothetical protein